MRSRLSVGLVMLCLGLAGCGLFQKNKNENTGKPFKGLPNTKDPVAGPGGNNVAGVDPSLPPRVDAVLAGQVVNKGSNRRLNMAHIEVVDLDKGNTKEARLGFETDPQGFFYIPGLQKGKHYQLIARARDDGRILAGAEFVSPPNIHVCIMLTEDKNPAYDSPLGPQPLPGQGPISNGPGAVLEPPVRPSASISAPPTSVAPQPPLAPERTVDATKDGFPLSPKVKINGPGSVPEQHIPPPPPIYPPAPPVDTQNPPFTQNVVPGSLTRYSDELAQAPSCVLVGNRLENMALRTLDGNIWEYKRNHKGRLVLLDFWSTSCGPCLRSIPHLCDLEGAFRPNGLEVIGIAYESGPPAEHAQKVIAARGRHLMNYKTLLGGGGPGPCPVSMQFQVDVLPKVFLLDERGNIVWKSGQDGLSPEKLRELRQEISMRLRVQRPYSP